MVFGGDHRRAFRHVVPAFAVALSASIIAEGRHLLGNYRWRPVWPASSANTCLRGFDIAVCRDIALDHAFAQPIRDSSVNSMPSRSSPCRSTAPPPHCPRGGAWPNSARRRQFLDRGPASAGHRDRWAVTFPAEPGDRYLRPQRRRPRTDDRRGMAEARTKSVPTGMLKCWRRCRVEVSALVGWSTPPTRGPGPEPTRCGPGGGRRSGRWSAGAPLVYEAVPEWITGMAVARSARTKPAT